ncbi:histone H3, putative [Theileria equi strain WA]|uniref:Histone H3, putative n=1 Tax=Theileria equi strain WA TaxID=1537102 RepID=L0AUN3_THEEQ|nr:histone H3, putative [Theileria equi strain WA]AFZ78933.1 histone H3, putative [Theileria equi strain WA]|eukprot:XP_004828599.1 histone H3, putative [Theileria equi strain WA]
MDDKNTGSGGSLFSQYSDLSPGNSPSRSSEQTIAIDTEDQTYTTNMVSAQDSGDPKKRHKQRPTEKKIKHVMKPPVVLTPARVIEEFKKGNLTKFEATEAVIRYRINTMLPHKSDGTHVDKEGNVIIPKGYDFGPGKDSKGRLFKRGGLTRIEREILAYQKSTHHLIPRAAFARIVREIAQGWYKGEGQIKFTVEALSALQTATEDEITKILEISTACSYHAKRITLKIDDMRLARFCRGRQEYESFNIMR